MQIGFRDFACSVSRSYYPTISHMTIDQKTSHILDRNGPTEEAAPDLLILCLTPQLKFQLRLLLPPLLRPSRKI